MIFNLKISIHLAHKLATSLIVSSNNTILAEQFGSRLDSGLKNPQYLFETVYMNRKGLIKIRLESSEPDLQFYDWSTLKDNETKIAVQYENFVEEIITEAKRGFNGRRLDKVKKYVELDCDLYRGFNASLCNFTYEAFYKSGKEIDI